MTASSDLSAFLSIVCTHLIFLIFLGLDLQVESLISPQQCQIKGFISSIIVRPQFHALGIWGRCLYILSSQVFTFPVITIIWFIISIHSDCLTWIRKIHEMLHNIVFAMIATVSSLKAQDLWFVFLMDKRS